ncbi:MAG: AMP-binding protein [Tepidisphaerales bacterium]
MLNRIIARLILLLLNLRYRIRVRGLGAILARGNKGILLLPNHPALIDPIILVAALLDKLSPRPLGDRRQIDRFFIRWIARRIGIRTLPDVTKDGLDSTDQIQRMLADTIEGLNRGENALMYPAGHVTYGRLEDLGGNSAAELLIHSASSARVVLVRTRGLWGSRFSRAQTREPNVGRILRQGVWWLLANGILFGPRRPVDIELYEPADLPRSGDRSTLNRYLERFYNQNPPPNTYVPYTIWERGGIRELPEPPADPARREELASVPPATRQLVLGHLRQLSGVGESELREEARLANDLGLDSLARAELVVWLEKEFGFRQSGPDSLRTVGEVMLAACGAAVSNAGESVKRPSLAWFAAGRGEDRVVVPEGDTITAVFLRQAARRPGRAAVADQVSGVKTYRDLITAILVLRPIIRKLPGDYVGIMLPASVAADVLFLSALFAGKTPVMVNWTVGRRNMLHSLDLLGVQHVLTAGALVGRLESEGMDLSGLKERFLLMEQVGKSIPLVRKVRAAIHSRLSWRTLENATPPANAVVLFTSGSESMPKAVPLTHANILTNIRDITSFIALYDNDRLLGIAPPFHSMGLTVTMSLPLCTGLKVVHSPNPMAGAVLAGVIEAYGATLLVGTPTFLAGIMRAAEPGRLATLRALVTAAEKCPPATYAALAERCPRARVLEAYGVTECSPTVSVNDYNDPRPQTIGKMLPSLHWTVVDVESNQPVPAGKSGMLLLRGPTIFGGYLNYAGPSPFVESQGHSWYRTGDLVHYDADNVFTFDGRLKRFVKLGGEMISLPAIEAVLAERCPPPDPDHGPTLAIEVTPTDEHPEIVLFTTGDLSREQANAHVRDAGLSPLYNIRRVIRLDAIPVLGTGKTDYRALKDLLRNEARGSS